MGAVPKICLSVLASVAAPPKAASILGAQEGLELSGGTKICSADILSNEQPKLGVHLGRTRFPTGQHPGPQAFQEAQGQSLGSRGMWVGYELCPVRSVPCRSSILRGGTSPRDSPIQRRAICEDRVGPFCLRGSLQSTDWWSTLGSIISSFQVLVSSHLPGRSELEHQVSFLL